MLSDAQRHGLNRMIRAWIIRARLSISTAYATLRRAWPAIDGFEVLVFSGLGLVCYGVAHLWSPDHAAIIAGAGLLVFALVGLVVRLRAPRQG